MVFLITPAWINAVGLHTTMVVAVQGAPPSAFSSSWTPGTREAIRGYQTAGGGLDGTELRDTQPNSVLWGLCAHGTAGGVSPWGCDALDGLFHGEFRTS